MTDVTRILNQIEDGDPSAADQLLPLVYAELRKLTAAKLQHEKPGKTLQATALVHEAYLRLVDNEKAIHLGLRVFCSSLSRTNSFRREVPNHFGRAISRPDGAHEGYELIDVG